MSWTRRGRHWTYQRGQYRGELIPETDPMRAWDGWRVEIHYREERDARAGRNVWTLVDRTRGLPFRRLLDAKRAVEANIRLRGVS